MDVSATDHTDARQRMVDAQIRPNGVREPQLLRAMREIPRERFLPPHLAPIAYIDEDIDLGGVFDTLNLRRNPPLLTAPEDANDNSSPFGVDMLSGFNVSTIALEVPASLLTRDGKGAGTGSTATIGRAETSRAPSTAARPIGAITTAMIGRPINGRNTTRSRPKPSSTMPPTESKADTQNGAPRISAAPAAMNPANMTNSPCAKLIASVAL